MKLKSELFCDERNTIVQQIFDILEINDNKNTFLLHELDDNVANAGTYYMKCCKLITVFHLLRPFIII
jgi:hypothetical protein